jgi:hypothetical protein
MAISGPTWVLTPTKPACDDAVEELGVVVLVLVIACGEKGLKRDRESCGRYEDCLSGWYVHSAAIKRPIPQISASLPSQPLTNSPS